MQTKTVHEKLADLARLFPALAGAHAEGTGGIDADTVIDIFHDFFVVPSHPDELAVLAFANKMSDKLKFAREVKGRGGWEDKAQCSPAYLSRLLREHVEKGDPVDVANLAMMLSMRDERILSLPS